MSDELEREPMRYPLTATQQRTVMALARELERLSAEIQETQAALDDLARRYAGEPEGVARFNRQENGTIVLEVMPRQDV